MKRGALDSSRREEFDSEECVFVRVDVRGLSVLDMVSRPGGGDAAC